MVSAGGLGHSKRLKDDLEGCHAPVGRAGVGVARRGDREQALGVTAAGMAVSLAHATIE